MFIYDCNKLVWKIRRFGNIWAFRGYIFSIVNMVNRYEYRFFTYQFIFPYFNIFFYFFTKNTGSKS